MYTKILSPFRVLAFQYYFISTASMSLGSDSKELARLVIRQKAEHNNVFGR